MGQVRSATRLWNRLHLKEKPNDDNALAVVVEESHEEGLVAKFRRRMLEWPNPVEYVNNMYGCHPDGDRDYFKEVFGQ